MKQIQKKKVGTKFVYEIEYVYLNRAGGDGAPASPFVSQVHPIQCDKDGKFAEGITVNLEGVHNLIVWGPNNVTKIAPGWVWRNERIIEVDFYEAVQPLN